MLDQHWFIFSYLLAGDMGARVDTGKENLDKGNGNNIYTIKIILLYIITLQNQKDAYWQSATLLGAKLTTFSEIFQNIV